MRFYTQPCLDFGNGDLFRQLGIKVATHNR